MTTETIADILEYGFRSFGEATAVQTYTEKGGLARLSFGEVAERARMLALRLRHSGIRKGSVVALLSENGCEWVVAFFGILLAGATLVSVDVTSKRSEIQNILQRCRATLLVTSKSLASTAREVARSLQGLRVVSLERLLSPDDFDARGRERTVPPASRPDDVAVISFTSGASGRPKGVVLTHRNIASDAIAASRAVNCECGDNVLSLLPLSHMFGLTAGLLIPFCTGARVTFVRTINPRTVLQAMRETGVTLAIIVPAVARLFYKRVAGEIEAAPAWKRVLFSSAYWLSKAASGCGIALGPLLFRSLHRRFGGQLRYFVSGGAPLDLQIAERFRVIGLPILQGYGLSEAAPIVCCDTLKDHRPGSVGKPLPGVQVKIVPRDGCEPGTGEILVRGPNVMAAYFEDPAATAEALKDGWLHTGDLGELDADGFLYICGRLKDTIISESGRNVYPEEVEAQIAKSPYVKDVCVVGKEVSANSRREQVVALVIPEEELLEGKTEEQAARVIRGDLKKACSDLADYKRPKYFALQGREFPRTRTLKLKRQEIASRIDPATLLPL